MWNKLITLEKLLEVTKMVDQPWPKVGNILWWFGYETVIDIVQGFLILFFSVSIYVDEGLQRSVPDIVHVKYLDV